MLRRSGAALAARTPSSRFAPPGRRAVSRRRGVAATAALASERQQRPQPKRVAMATAEGLMKDMTTVLGDPTDSCFTGYAGEWSTFEVELSGGAGADAAFAPHKLKLVDDAINIRLWKTEPGGRLAQANLYQAPENMAGGTCTRFAPYLRADATRPGSIRPDGYGLRCWTFGPESDLVSPSGARWLDPSAPAPPHRSMRVLTVADEAAAIVNGALPPAFEAGKGDIWVLEFILKDPSSHARRWATMNWFEDGVLAVNRSVNEDLVQLPADLDSHTIDPAAVRAAMAPRRDAAAVLPAPPPAGNDAGSGGAVDHYASSKLQSEGSFVLFEWAGPALSLAREEGEGCRWGAARGGPGPVVEQVYPDCSYCRLPPDLRALAAAGETEVTFEAGTVLSDGTLGRWLLTYSLEAPRLVKRAVYERYPPAAPGGGA